MRKFILALAAAIMLAGCVGKPSPHQIETTRLYQQPKEAIWQRLLAHLATRHWPLNIVDVADGTIYAEPWKIGQHTGYADCGERAGWGADPQEFARLNVFVTPVDAASSKVAIDIKFTELLSGLAYRDCTSLGGLEAQILDALR